MLRNMCYMVVPKDVFVFVFVVVCVSVCQNVSTQQTYALLFRSAYSQYTAIIKIQGFQIHIQLRQSQRD